MMHTHIFLERSLCELRSWHSFSFSKNKISCLHRRSNILGSHYFLPLLREKILMALSHQKIHGSMNMEQKIFLVDSSHRNVEPFKRKVIHTNT